MENNYEIGYGRPPKDSRFKPGQSGNRNGRPKGSRNTYTIIKDILDQKIAVKENGKTVRISKRTAVLTQLINKGIKGNIRAISALLPHILASDMKEEEKNALLANLSSDDQEIISYFIKKTLPDENITKGENENGESEPKP